MKPENRRKHSSRMHNLHQISLDRAGGPRSDVQGGSTRGVPGLMFRGASAGGGLGVTIL